MSSTNLLSEVTKLQKMISELVKSTSSQFTEQGSKIVDIISEMDFMKAQLALARLGSTIIGEIKFFAFDKDYLPEGYYFCGSARAIPGGGAYPLDSPQGQALHSLDDLYKNRMGIVVQDGKINVPNFFTEDGKGYFVRAANGTVQEIGLSGKQGDAIRNITGSITPQSSINAAGIGAFKSVSLSLPIHTGGGYNGGYRHDFDASTQVPTADENRPINIGLTPAIFLGV